MSLSDKKEYKALYGKAIINLRNPMPDESAKVILKAAQKGTFSLINNVKTIAKNDEGFSYGPMPGLYAHGALVNGVVYQNNSTIKIQQMAERAFSDNK